MNGRRLLSLVVGATLVGLLLVSSCAPSKSTALGGLKELDEWDLLVIGDLVAVGVPSWFGGLGVAESYAAHIEEDLGVPVNVQDRGARLLSARRVLDVLQEPESDPDMKLRGWPDLLHDAEVVVFVASPEDSVSDTHPGDWQCIRPPYHVVDCSPETFEAFAADLDAVYDEVLRLRDGSPTIIRALEYFAPMLSEWRQAGVERDCTRCWENMNAVIRHTAEAHGVPVAPLYDVFNGPDHDEDPEEAGYTSQTWRLSEAGVQAIAEQLRELGYEPVTP